LWTHNNDIEGKHGITTDIINTKKPKEKHTNAAELKQSALTTKHET